MIWKTYGFDFIKEFFEKATEGNSASWRISHAYIFSGQEMIGKRTLALELANLINKTDNPVTHPDILVIDPAFSETGESISIKEIRNAKSFLSLSAYEGPYKFVIINDADKMTIESQNAFLKILEEANPFSMIILITAHSSTLLPTIYSRCQEINFPNHPVQIIEKVLLKEGTSKEKADFLSKFVNGRLGLALKIVKEDLYSKIKSYISELADIKKASLNEKFKIAQTLNSEVGNQILREKLLYWMLYLRMHMTTPDSAKTLKHLIDLNYLIGQPQFNRRLILENFMVKM